MHNLLHQNENVNLAMTEMCIDIIDIAIDLTQKIYFSFKHLPIQVYHLTLDWSKLNGISCHCCRNLSKY